MNSPTPDCLFIDQPAVSEFVFKMLYQEDHLSAARLLNHKSLGIKVLRELRDFPAKAYQCPTVQKK